MHRHAHPVFLRALLCAATALSRKPPDLRQAEKQALCAQVMNKFREHSQLLWCL